MLQLGLMERLQNGPIFLGSGKQFSDDTPNIHIQQHLRIVFLEGVAKRFLF